MKVEINFNEECDLEHKIDALDTVKRILLDSNYDFRSWVKSNSFENNIEIRKDGYNIQITKP